MAGTTFCDVSELYNILNQYTRLSRLPQLNYLCLIDARAKGQYNASHIITSLRPYKVELLPGQLYLGDYKQAISPHVLKDLKLSALVNVSHTSHVCEDSPYCVANVPHLGSRLNTGSAVQIFSSHRISRCSAAAIAFLLHHLKYTLGASYIYIFSCLLWNLSDWELHTLGRRMTDIAVPCY
uniref:Serine/threonine/tyrosine interacting-like 1 n=1 Tax=Oncorhynchus kisutch TaxID=8019 RepID=A0A8C7L1V2_ONCKI